MMLNALFSILCYGKLGQKQYSPDYRQLGLELMVIQSYEMAKLNA
jgi:hypothetical protein